MSWTQSLARRGVSMQSQIMAGLVVLGLVLIVGVIVETDYVPITSLMVPLLLGQHPARAATAAALRAGSWCC